MYAFGMLGSYFSQGVYAVAGPFQGAVDIIVVQQQDGTFKSSPWYVKCGDFQGVLTRREKIVDISVNGVPASFCMLLNSRGEAYFEKEVEDAVLALPSTSSELEDSSFNLSDGSVRQTEKTNSRGECAPSISTECNTTDQKRIRQDDSSLQAAPENLSLQSHLENLSLQTPPGNLDDRSSCSASSQSAGLQGKTDAIEHAACGWDSSGSAQSDSTAVTDDFVTESRTDSPKPSDLDVDVKPVAATQDTACGRDTSDLAQTNATNSTAERREKDLTAESRTEESKPSDSGVEAKHVVFNVSGENLILAEADSIFSKAEQIEEKQHYGWPFDLESGGQDGDRPYPLGEAFNASASTAGIDDAMLRKLATAITEDWFSLQEASGIESSDKKTNLENDLGTSDANVMDELIWNDYKIVTAEEERELHNALKTDSVLGVRIDDQGSEPDTQDAKSSAPSDSSVWISDALVDDATSKAAMAVMEDTISLQDNNAEASADGATSGRDVVCRVDEGPPTEGSEIPGGSKAAEIPTIAVVPPPSRWSMWPLSFRKSRREKASVSEAAAKRQALLAATKIAVGSPLTEEILRKNGYNEWTQKPKLRSYVPTSAQIESLKLKEGPNKVTFTFPRVLGRTQVDANIYLWKWTTRIVISDVDGTITKSDVLGQFMPLVGRDWSQSGVTRLFSAIKENGYEVLFLSARAISQAYLTRQFLINLKQDGETLPEGPVFISPDGLIPSLYREVVRRAPHEFKISCLEGIKRLFPNDVNPFYAGFGNRDTDTISYLKVGIPKGKIFIINPKGEVMVNNHVDVKSYTSIHALVDDMFPPVYSSEQEDFNTWNYWKLPLPDIDAELSSSDKSMKGKKGVASKR